MAEKDGGWDPVKRPAPEFRGVGLTYEQFNQIATMLRTQALTNVALSASLMMVFGFLFYVFLLGDANNYLSRITAALEAMAG